VRSVRSAGPGGPARKRGPGAARKRGRRRAADAARAVPAAEPDADPTADLVAGPVGVLTPDLAAGPAAEPLAARPAGRAMLPEVLGFALAGGAAYAADLGLFVWLRGPGGLGPLTAKALSFLAGCTVAYLGNALGTYRGRTPAVGRARRYGVFFAVNIAGAVVQLLCLACSHYLLGLTDPRDDLVSGLGVGMLLATALRFWGTRTLVFRAARAPRSATGSPGRGTAGVPGPEEGNRPTWTG
jgi:putative flippase GtrA